MLVGDDTVDMCYLPVICNLAYLYGIEYDDLSQFRYNFR